MADLGGALVDRLAKELARQIMHGPGAAALGDGPVPTTGAPRGSDAASPVYDQTEAGYTDEAPGEARCDGCAHWSHGGGIKGGPEPEESTGGYCRIVAGADPAGWCRFWAAPVASDEEPESEAGAEEYEE